MRTVVLAAAVTTMAAGFLLVGCASSPAGPQSGASGSGAGQTSDSCGLVSLGQGESVPPAYLECLSTAADAGSPATLTVVTPTTEGDDIVLTYTVVDPGTVKVRHDSTADKFAAPGTRITEETCKFRVSGGEIQTNDCTEPVPL